MMQRYSSLLVVLFLLFTLSLSAQQNYTQYKYNNKGSLTDSIVYRDGKPVIFAKFIYFGKDSTLGSYTLIDSQKNTLHSIYYKNKDTIRLEAFFEGNKGIVKYYDSTSVKIDSVFSREEKDAEFPGGSIGWAKYLQKNLNANVPIDNGARAGTYTIVIRFVISKEGNVEDISVENKAGYGIDEEGIRIIKNGPKWIPAIQFGKAVRAYRRQPLTFVVEDETKPQKSR